LNTQKISKSLLALVLGSLVATSGRPLDAAQVFASSALLHASVVLAAPQQQATQPVYALQGTLNKATNQNFATYMITSDGTAYALVGETPEVEQQIIALREQGANTLAKVWGVLYPQGRLSATPEIVVTSIVPAESVPTPTPQAQPIQPQATVTAASINVRRGPGTAYPVIGALQQGQTCTLIGKNAAATWWQVQCASGLQGWVFGELVVTTGDIAGIPVVNTPPPPPTPTPAPPTVFNGWKASVWHNMDLAGEPARVADVREIAFDWGDGPPEWPDHFSTRFERTINFNPGTYRFVTRADDGVRVFIDGQLIINEWHTATGLEYTADRSMYGNQRVRVEHYEDQGLASLYFSFYPLGNTTIDGGGSGDWTVSYYNNPDLSGNPVLIRREPRSPYPLDVDWGAGSPAPGLINDDNFSARWIGTFYFDAGDWIFRTRTDDGVRVYIDGIRLIDAWNDGYKEPSNRFNRLGAGNHTITIEYYERGGVAFNRVWWWRDSSGSGGGSSPGSSGVRPERDQ
jgi:uncharacterized protein YraI